MRYKFENFNVEIEPTEIFVDLNTIRDKAVDKTITVDVILIADGCRYGVHAEDMPYEDSWSDSDIEPMVYEWLNSYRVYSSARVNRNTTTTEEITKLEEIVGTTQVESKSSEEESTIVNLSWYAKLILKIKSLFNF